MLNMSISGFFANAACGPKAHSVTAPEYVQKGDMMKTYELTCAFRMKAGQDVAGIEAVKQILADAQASIQSEEDMGDRELAYEVDNETRARYRLFIVDLDQKSLLRVEELLKLRNEILRYMLVVRGS